MFELEERKKYTKYVIEEVENFLLKFVDKKGYAGLVVVGFHYFLIVISVTYIMFGSVNIFYYICSLLYLLIIILHFICGGCILTRIERSLLETKEWYGPISMLLYGIEDASKERTNNMVIFLAITIVTNIILKLFNENINLSLLMLLVVIYFRLY